MLVAKKTNMKKLAIITHNMSFGGVQRVIKNHIDYFNELFEISLVLFEKKEINFNLPVSVKIIYLDQKVFDYQNLISKHKKEILTFGKKLFSFRVNSMINILSTNIFDTIISHEDYNNIVTLKAMKKLNYSTNLIVTSHIFQNSYKNSLIHLCDEYFYKKNQKKYYRNHKVVTVSSGVNSDFKKYGITTVVIDNGVNIKEAKEKSNKKCKEQNFILCIGRIEFIQKGQNDLLKAFNKIKDKIDQNLLFIGEGKDKDKLEKMIDKYKIQDRVRILSFVKNPFKYMANAKIVIFPSYYEGLPNTILEALAVEAAIISYNFKPSSKEISNNGKFFPLVQRGNIGQLSKKIENVLKNKKLKLKMMELSKKRAQDYDIKIMISKWLEIIRK